MQELFQQEMLTDPRKRPLDPEEYPFQEEEDVASFTECTGIMPMGLQDGWHQNNTAALYAIHGRPQNDENPLDDEDWPE